MPMIISYSHFYHNILKNKYDILRTERNNAWEQVSYKGNSIFMKCKKKLLKILISKKRIQRLRERDKQRGIATRYAIYDAYSLAMDNIEYTELVKLKNMGIVVGGGRFKFSGQFKHTHTKTTVTCPNNYN